MKSFYYFIDEIASAEDEKRATFIRAMLIAGDSPLEALLNQIMKEDVFSYSDHDRPAFKAFIKNYEQKRVMLEELSAIPTALTSEEMSLVKPICNQLNSILYNLQEPNSDIEWKMRIAEYQESAQKKMQDRYTTYQADDRIKRINLFAELHHYKEQIKNGSFLGKKEALSITKTAGIK
jgi:hypothetical protein